jgi:hypothetical protein
MVYEVLRSPGQPLDSSIRAFFEPRFGHDFSKVRVHTDTKAADSARVVNARAYTVGTDVVFADSTFSPHQPKGRELLAHELTHVLQQKRTPPTCRVVSHPQLTNELEGEANAISSEIAETLRSREPGASTKFNLLLRKPAGVEPDIPAQEPSRHGGELEDILDDIRTKREDSFRKLSEHYRSSLLETAGIKDTKTISTPEQALAILKSLKVDLKQLDERLKKVRESTKGALRGSPAVEDVETRAADAVAALSTKGQETFAKAVEEVRKEAFYDGFLSSGRVLLIPDESACSRYWGYTQSALEREPVPGAKRAKRRHYFVHLCKKTLEVGDVAAVRAVLAHELSHAVAKEFAGEEAATLITKPVLREIAAQLAKLPEYKGLESTLSQFLYEKVGGYSEAEVFAALQELPHHPKLRENDRLLATIVCELRRLDASRFPPDIRERLIGELKLRTEFFYDARIRKEHGAEAKRLAYSKAYATTTLEQALTLRKLEREGEYPYAIRCAE